MVLVVALRQLGLTLKGIYRLDVKSLSRTVKDAVAKGIEDKEVWDALLYRTAVVRAELKPMDLAVTVSAMARIRRQEPAFVQYLLEEVRTKAYKFPVNETSNLLNAFAKLAINDELLTRSLVAPMMRRITDISRWEDLAVLALSLSRLGGASREPICDRIVASITPRLESIKDGHTLSLLACAFSFPRGESRAGQSLFALGDTADVPIELRAGEGETLQNRPEIAHLSFVEEVLICCERHIFLFDRAAVLHLCLAIATLQRNGYGDSVPAGLFKRLMPRTEALCLVFMPAQLVRLLELMAYMPPEVEERWAKRVLEEVSYRARDVTPASAISVLRSIRRIGGHDKAHSAMSWRLTREDAGKLLTPAQAAELASILADLPTRWESREALLNCLHGLSGSKHELDAVVLSKLLHYFGRLGIRDTHWFYLWPKVQESGNAYRYDQPAAGPIFLEEQTLADATLGLAQLNLPQLLTTNLLFSQAEGVVTAAKHAAVMLQAAAILDLMQRRPEDLTVSAVQPLVALMEEDAPQNIWHSVARPLFPFSRLAAEACSPAVLSAWQHAARAEAPSRSASTSASGSAGANTSIDAVIAAELFSWQSVGMVRNVVVGPIVVPFALSLTGLADSIQSTPLLGIDPEDHTGGEATLAVGSDAKEKIGGLRAMRRRARQSSVLADQPIEASKEVPPRTLLEDQGAGEEETLTRAASSFGGRKSRRPPQFEPQLGRAVRAEGDSQESLLPASSDTKSAANPETHVLIEILREQDFYHASGLLRGERQRAKTQVLSVQRGAELALLRQVGWRVCCIPEHAWAVSDDGTRTASEQNRELIFRLVSELSAEAV